MKKLMGLLMVLMFLGSLGAVPAFQGGYVKAENKTLREVGIKGINKNDNTKSIISNKTVSEEYSGIVKRDATNEALAILSQNSKGTLVNAEFEGVNSQILIVSTPKQGFPTDGDTYLILSTGKAIDVLDGTAEKFISTDLHGRTGVHPRLNNIMTFDVATLKITLKVPENAETLSFKWKFGTEEIPSYIHSQFMDYFRTYVILPDGSKKDVTVLPNGEIPYVDTIVDYVNVPTGDSIHPAPPFPIPNDVALNAITTAGSKERSFIPFTSTIDVTPYQGQEITIIFEIGDAGDGIYDSAVFIDELGFDVKSSPNVEIDFLYDPKEPTVGENIWFEANIPDTLKGKEIMYHWDFGDGNEIETQEVSTKHKYQEGSKKYFVTLTVKVKENGEWKEVKQISKPIYVKGLSEQEQEIYKILTKIDQWFDKADDYISNSDINGIVSSMFDVYLSQEDIVSGKHDEYLPRIPNWYPENAKGISPKYQEFAQNAPAPTITSSEFRNLLKYLHNVKIFPTYVKGIVISKTANGEFAIKYPDKTVYIREVTIGEIPGFAIIYRPQYMEVHVNTIQKTITILAEPKLIFDMILNKVSSRVDLWFGTSCIILFGKEICPEVKSVFNGDFDIHGGASVGIDVLSKLGDFVKGKLSILPQIFKVTRNVIKLANKFGISIQTEGSMGIEGGVEFKNLKMQKYYFKSWSSVQLDDIGGETSFSVGVRADNPDILKAAVTLPLNLGATLALTSKDIPVVNELMYSAYVGMISIIPGDWKEDLYVEGSASKNLIDDKKYGPVTLGIDAELGTSMKLVPVWDPRWNINVHGGVIGKVSAESPPIPLASVLSLNLYGEAELPILQLEFGDPVEPNTPEIYATFIDDQPIGNQGLYNAITLSFNITTDAPCNCSIMPLLILNNTPVVALKNKVHLQKGSNIVTLTVPGQYIYLTNYNGLFNVGLIINDENGNLVYSNFSLGTTKSYNYKDFAHVIPRFNINYEPIDKDSDGLYDAVEFNITEISGPNGITLRPILTAPGWIIYLNKTNLTTSSTYITELDGMYVRKLAGNFTFVFYVYNTTNGIYLGTYSKKIVMNPSEFESTYPTIQSFEPIVVNNTPALKFKVSVPQKSNLTITVKYKVGNTSYESSIVCSNIISDAQLIVPLNKNLFVLHNTTTTKIISAELISDGLIVDTVPINQEVTFSIIPDARILSVETFQVNDSLLVSAYITSYEDVNATVVAVLTFGNESVVSYRYLTLRSLIPTGTLTVFNFTLENLTDAIKKSNGFGQLSLAVYDDSGNLLAVQNTVLNVIYKESKEKMSVESASEKHPVASIITLSRVWTQWFFKYYDEFNELYVNATEIGIDNETLQKALELHNNATNLIKDAWRADDLESIRNNLWRGSIILPIPKFWEIRKAYLLEKQAIEILRNAIKNEE